MRHTKARATAVHEGAGMNPADGSSATNNPSYILVALAGRLGDACAVQTSVMHSVQFKAEIVLLYVIPAFYLSNSGWIPAVWPNRYTDAKDYEEAEGYVQKLGERCIPEGQPWSFMIREGNEAGHIIKAAETLHPNLIVFPPENTRNFSSALLFRALLRRLLRTTASKVEVATRLPFPLVDA